jgi:hypothetical protein
MDTQAPPKDDSGFSGATKATTITLALDDYEDLFSDFDPRPYSERSLSEDFLFELKHAALYKEERGLTLTLYLPKEKSVPDHEKVILERLRDHFRRHHKLLRLKRKSEIKNGIKMVILGVAFMFLATYILYEFKQTFLTSFIVVLLEPAGWFTLWEGMNMILFHVKEITPDLEFHRKMSGAKIAFVPPKSPAEATREHLENK